jgi:hypothetical protein
MQRRRFLCSVPGGSTLMTPATPAWADGFGRTPASYYARHQVLVAGRALTWRNDGTPQRAQPAFTDFVQAGASQDAWFALRGNGDLLTWGDGAAAPAVLMRGAARFAAGQLASAWRLSQAQRNSTGLRSGEYGGRNAI